MEKWIYDDTNLGFKPGGVLHKEHCPTLRAERSGLKVIEVTKCILYGMLTNGVYAKMHDCSRRVYDTEGISPTIHTVGGGNLEPKVITRGRVQEGGKICPTITAESNGLCRIEPCIAAMRGRNPENPTSRASGLPTQQMLEVKDDGTSNTLTTVQKDNLVIESDRYVRYTDDGFHLARTDEKHSSIQGTHVTYPDGNVHCMGTSHKPMVLEPHFRVRKLTPKECWRLMGFTDEDFDKAKQGLNETHYKGRDRSNSQLYKQAGNSIVKQVLMAIFGEMKGGAE